MTIKEIETLAEMPRANIRFYESEGLLSPARNVNGYRDYSKEDLEVLKKIKLLRSLHMSIEKIKALHTGEQELSVALEQQIKQLAEDQTELDKAQSVCETMYRDRTEYTNLDADKYLSNLKYGVPAQARNTQDKYPWEAYWDAREASEDTLPKVQIPWRRYFARALDEAFYSLIWSCIQVCVLNINLSNRGTGANFLDIIMLVFLTVILEPLQLNLFGTTLGKWILGLSVWHNDDRKLTYSEAFTRTCQVLFYGLGFHVPVYSYIRMWKSYKACTNMEDLSWEYDSRIIIKDDRSVRIWAYIGTRVLIPLIVLMVVALAQRPVHRGELSVPQFCQNYRILADYCGMENGYTLTNEGTWDDMAPEGSVVISVLGGTEPPVFQFEIDEDGKIKSISFVVEYQNDGKDRAWMSSQQSQMQLAALAFVGAQDSFPVFSNQRYRMTKKISSHVFEDYRFSEAGIQITCDVEMKGYRTTGTELLMPTEETESYFYMEFKMEKERD